tara:strand:+ start:1315 stop:1680 length:366 start_codon:yes stop_codon:yes gene_type:complete
MKVKKNNRKFKVGKKNDIIITDAGSVFLKNDELVTLKDGKKELDIGKKNWGYYGTPTLNKRLPKFGYLAVLTRNKIFDTYAVLIVDKRKKKTFLNYLKREDMKIICWLNHKNLIKIKNTFV